MAFASSKPFVSIVIPFYNDPYVTEAIESVLAQTYRDYEIIVVDDGSNAHQDLLGRYEDRIHYIGQSNGGTASALNSGFRLASGKYVAWLSSDDRFYPDKIKRQVEAMERTGSLISHTGFDVIDGRGKMTAFDIIPPDIASGDFYRAFQQSNPVNGSTVVMTKELFRLIGPFSETMRYTHDLDYWFRVLLSGTPFLLLPEPLCAYRRHEEMGTVKHKEAIELEVKGTFAKYEARWKLYLRQLGLVPRAREIVKKQGSVKRR
ncbi:glycosyltransferase [Paenibacillus rhizovicinus]|uniref:Glycosyltransferase n=1 Tax=Paenibacillus rhizovicinus TaxID=2704463 RepID=A0A6C0P6T6_9BACL|nr:glycosyltransferase [Paenibacillus rhizovicinus]QHW33423.1 glycosyltransferase [Paenibacillus rhizovicinus]